MQKIAMKLRDQIPAVDLIVTSPYVRAKQTAEILSQIFFDTPIVEASELVPQAPPEALLKWLRAHAKDAKDVIVVGHDPQLCTFASYLLAAKEESFIEIKKSAVVCIKVASFGQMQAGSGILRWAVPPKLWVD